MTFHSENRNQVLMSGAFASLVSAARGYAAARLLSEAPSVAEENLAACAFDLVQETSSFGKMWSELRQALGVRGGSNDNEHKNMLLRIVDLLAKEQAHETMSRNFAAIQADANIALEQRREADARAIKAKESQWAYESCVKSVRTALGCGEQDNVITTAQKLVRELEEAMKLRERVDATQKRIEELEAKVRNTAQARSMTWQELEDENESLKVANADLRRRIEAAEQMLEQAAHFNKSVTAYVQSARNDLGVEQP